MLNNILYRVLYFIITKKPKLKKHTGKEYAGIECKCCKFYSNILQKYVSVMGKEYKKERNTWYELTNPRHDHSKVEDYNRIHKWEEFPLYDINYSSEPSQNSRKHKRIIPLD